MIFGDVPLSQAKGAVLAHSRMVGGRKWAKGRVLSEADIALLQTEGVSSVIAARLDPGDVDENTAAARIAAAVAGDGLRARAPATGRVNLHATHAGLFQADTGAVDRLNTVSEAITLATLPALRPVAEGTLVATVKIIPFAVPGDALDHCAHTLAAPALRVAPWHPLRAGLVQTRVAGTKESVLDKTATATRDRLAVGDNALIGDWRCPHRADAVAVALTEARAAGCGLILMIGASAITDRADVLPSALEAVGGTVAHFGMPVDPGNLLMLGDWDGHPVLGLPGCARSPRLNGADWVLWRLMAGLPVGPREIMGLGVGGLIADIADRPLPRDRAPRHASQDVTPPGDAVIRP